MVRLNALEAAAFICALEDAVAQLSILSFLERDRGREGATLRPLTDEKDLGQSDRVRRQRGRIKSIFERLIGRLSISADIGSLIEMSHGLVFHDNKAEMVDIEGDTGHWNDPADVKQQEAEMKQDIEAVKQTAATLEHAIGKLKEANRLGLSERNVVRHLLSRWSATRLQFQQLSHCRREDATWQITQQTRIQKRHEYRVHSEVVRHLHQVTQDLKAQSESWKTKYERYSLHWNQAIKALREDKQEHWKRLQTTGEKLDRRMEFCEAVLKIREAKRVESETRRTHNAAATRIQSWWRGHLVRRGFGALNKRIKQKQQKTRSGKS